jgi:CBS domain-containing protein
MISRYIYEDFTAESVGKKAITIQATDSLSDARDIMLKHNISRIVVVRNRTPLGVITEKGIASYLYKEIGESLDEIRTSKAITKNIISVSKDTPIYECARIMIDNKISSLIIPNHETSIFTKSDLVRLYAENYKQINNVRDFMTKNVLTLLPSHSLHSALAVMLKNKVSRVIIVTKDNKLVGIITSRDLMPITAFVEGDKFEKTVDNLSGIGHVMLARDVMKKPISITDTADLAVAAQIMNDKRISGLPVIDSENNLNGIVTRTDIVKALLETKKELIH